MPRSRALLLALLMGCAPPNPATPYPSAEPREGQGTGPTEPQHSLSIAFLDRQVDLEPFLRGFPYRTFMANLEHDRVFFLATGEQYQLRSATIGSGPLDLAGADPITTVDWSKRSLWSAHFHAPSNSLWVHADAQNDERMNLWRIDLNLPLEQREPEPITTADYVYSHGFSPDERSVAYLARTGTRAPYRTCLRIFDVDAPRTEREIVCDDPALSFTWGEPQFSPDGGKLYFNALVEGDRNRTQIVEVDLKAEGHELSLITDPKRPRSSAQVLEGWRGDTLYYTANDHEFGDVYAWSSKTRKARKLTSLGQELLGATLTDRGIVLAHGTPVQSTLEMVDPDNGRVIGSASVPGRVTIEDGHGDRALWSQEGPGLVMEISLAHFASGPEGLDMSNRRIVELDPQLAASLVRCRSEAVEIPGASGLTLHAWLLTPTEGSTSSPIAMIRSFYGGANEWNEYDHILCAAGITVISPAVRGSDGFGRAYAALNDSDLGGLEIVDVFMVGRWAAAKLGIGPKRVGVYGRSHGGYATMRALTWAHDDPLFFGFGFGLAEAGFSDILAFWAATNIPDWVVLEAGDPTMPEDLARLQDRSPLSHVDRLDVPLFLLHGANDWRVPADGSRKFAARAKELKKPVTYLEVEGQGHRIEGDERIVAAWQARLDFIAAVVGADG